MRCAREDNEVARVAAGGRCAVVLPGCTIFVARHGIYRVPSLAYSLLGTYGYFDILLHVLVYISSAARASCVFSRFDNGKANTKTVPRNAHWFCSMPRSVFDWSFWDGGGWVWVYIQRYFL